MRPVDLDRLGARPLDPDDPYVEQPGRRRLLLEVIGQVEVAPGEAIVAEVARALLDEPSPFLWATEPRPCGVADRTFDRRPDDRDPGHGGQPRDPSREDPAARTDHPDGLVPGTEPVTTIDQVVERPEEQGRIEAVVAHRQRAGVAQRGREVADTTGRLHVPGHGIDQQDGVASLRQGGGVQPRAATDVDDARSCGYPLAHQLLSSLELQHPLSRPADETIALVELEAVVGADAGVHMLLGRQIGHAGQCHSSESGPHRDNPWRPSAVPAHRRIRTMEPAADLGRTSLARRGVGGWFAIQRRHSTSVSIDSKMI